MITECNEQSVISWLQFAHIAEYGRCIARKGMCSTGRRTSSYENPNWPSGLDPGPTFASEKLVNKEESRCTLRVWDCTRALCMPSRLVT